MSCSFYPKTAYCLYSFTYLFACVCNLVKSYIYDIVLCGCMFFFSFLHFSAWTLEFCRESLHSSPQSTCFASPTPFVVFPFWAFTFILSVIFLFLFLACGTCRILYCFAVVSHSLWPILLYAYVISLLMSLADNKFRCVVSSAPL